ncbi:alcohol dehydrogenase [Kineobactrum sediminis]|uniref:Alcohol dehydrogenase n=1 Tax=Kineobactrum sediminis TaxID=1905677 RepID=A0A2N5Y282_9GAMM|nr:SDR family oxidoreductase [Kineobactrum sediminis]PLW82503.1 alcohol dehydrogenase [Kineobactrum sediminis]
MTLQDKHVLITGPTAGIGRTTALALAAQGASLTLLCRNPDKGAALADEITAAGGVAPTVVMLDMASLASVRQAAQECLELGRPVDVLLNNAGIVNTSRRTTVDGFEETLAVNHFAPFLLTGLLLPTMLEVPGARIVNVASAAHAFVRGMGFDDLHAEHGYKTFREYGRSKLANILFTRSLAQRLAAYPVTVNSLHPGAVSTSLGTQNGGVMSRIVPLLIKPFFRTPEQGAQTSIYLCTSDAVAGTSGEYFANCKPVRPKPWARDEEAAQQLWRITEESVGFQYPV